MYDNVQLLFDQFLFVDHLLIQMNNVKKEMAKPKTKTISIKKKILQLKF